MYFHFVLRNTGNLINLSDMLRLLNDKAYREQVANRVADVVTDTNGNLIQSRTFG